MTGPPKAGTAEDYPSWMRTEAVRARYADRLPPPGLSYATVFLSRIWLKTRDTAENAPRSGMLEQYCYDYIHNGRERCFVDLKERREE